MKHLKFVLVSALAVGGFSGCNGYHPNTAAAGTVPAASNAPVSLEGLSSKDLLRTKYDQAVVNCQLEFLIGESFEITKGKPADGYNSESSSGGDSLSWDLLNDYEDQKSFELNAKNPGDITGYRGPVTIKMTVDFDKIEIMYSNDILDESTGISYTMLYSPVVTAHYSFVTDKPILFQGLSSQPSEEGRFSLNETIRSQVIDESQTGSLQDQSISDGYVILFACTFNAKIKPAYQSQFVTSAQ